VSAERHGEHSGSGRPLIAPAPRRCIDPGPVATFSLAVAAYQVADLIGETLESALAQTLPALEIIVCDDGSTDDLDRALAPYHNAIRLIRKQNGGVMSAYNAIVRAARGDFVVITDPDDVFEPERIESLTELAARRPDLDILTTDAFVAANGDVIGRFYTDTNRFAVEDQRKAILGANFIFGLAALRRQRILDVGGFDESIVSTGDWELFIRLILDGARAGLVDQPLATYRLREGSITSNRARLLQGRLTTLSKTLEHPGLSAEEREIVQRGIDDQRRALAVEDARSSVAEGREDARLLARGVMLGPNQPLLTRLKASIAVVAPGFAARRVRRKRERATSDAAQTRSARE
jgi:Glycosyl transferase family 2